MLKIFLGINNVPKDLDIIYDVEKFFGSTKLRDCDYVRKVINAIECGSYLSEYAFTDRFGYGLRSSCLSTTSKILISALEYPKYVINATELGDNGLELLSACKEGQVLFNRSSITFNTLNANKVMLNGVVCESVEKLNYLISVSEV